MVFWYFFSTLEPIILMVERLEIAKTPSKSLLFLGEDELAMSAILFFPFLISSALKA